MNPQHNIFNPMSTFIKCAAMLGLAARLADGAMAPPPEDFPRFIVPGYEKEMASLRALFWLHYEPAGPLIPLRDEWMPMSTLWPARDAEVGPAGMRSRWAATF